VRQIEWLRQHVRVVIEEIDAERGILGVAADEKHLRLGARLPVRPAAQAVMPEVTRGAL
jgi:hypothetical protein